MRGSKNDPEVVAIHLAPIVEADVDAVHGLDAEQNCRGRGHVKVSECVVAVCLRVRIGEREGGRRSAAWTSRRSGTRDIDAKQESHACVWPGRQVQRGKPRPRDQATIVEPTVRHWL
eukprot:7181784-Heterocapsa_arctica.AAC.1